jgi:hypothetical protein
MGLRGRRLIERHHSVDASAERFERVYAWLLGREPPPPQVQSPSEVEAS